MLGIYGTKTNIFDRTVQKRTQRRVVRAWGLVIKRYEQKITVEWVDEDSFAWLVVDVVDDNRAVDPRRDYVFDSLRPS